MATVGRFSAGVTVLAAALVAGRGAGAMGIRYDRTRLARSADGASALYEVRGWGPEGGGSLAYRVEGKARGKGGVEFLVSSNFSPGGASKPQIVATATCAQRLAALAEEVTRRAIRGVAIHPERCRDSEREQLVTIDATTGSPPSKDR